MFIMKTTIIFALFFILISCNKDFKKNNVKKENVEKLDSVSLVVSEKTKFLRKYNFNEKAKLSDGQFKELKNALESSSIKNIPFCDIFQKSLDIFNYSKHPKADYKKLFSKYKKIPNFKSLVDFYGFKLCQSKPINNITTTHTKAEVENLLSDWNGSLPSLVEYTKQHLNNPDSFKHVETGYIRKPNYILIKMIYRAENVYGATIKTSISAKVDYNGKIINIIE